MKIRRIISAMLFVIMTGSSISTVPAGEREIGVSQEIAVDEVVSEAAVQIAELAASYTDKYAVDGGYIYFNADTGAITGADTSITSADIPSVISNVSVISIGSNAFESCSSLTSITIPSSITSIDSWAFYKCSSLTSITIPSSITSIGSYAFNSCSRLTSVSIPSSVTSIGGGAFCYCSSLTSITIPNSITSIGGETFRSCSSLMSITIPSSVTSIGDSAFIGCSSLTSITIPDGVTNIGDSAFLKCSGLANITIPGSVISIGSWTFSGCSSLTNVTIEEGVTSIGEDAFGNCSYLTNVNIPGSVTSIGEKAFEYCSSLTNLIISDGVTYIGRRAFYQCDGLTNITIPESVTNISSEAFYGCDNLINITIPSNVTSIGSDAFYYCPFETAGPIGGNYDYEFGWTETIPSYAFDSCNSLINIDMPSSITKIGSYAFSGCSSLTSINIPNSVTYIDNYAFFGCSSLTSIDVPSGITKINCRVFSGCSNLTVIEIPNGVTKIDIYSFANCSSLSGITIPSSVESIDDTAFNNCDKDLLVFYVVEGSYADTWATENGWMVSYTAAEETTEETTETVLRSLDVCFNDSSVIYNVDEGTYSSDSISLCGYASFWYLFTDLADSELGYPKNVSVEITLPEGFYFGSEDDSEEETEEGSEEDEETDDSKENKRMKVLTYEEITGTNYITETVYLDNPSRGTYTVTVNVTGDNVEEKTVTCKIVVVNNEFQLNQYRANYLLNSTTIPESIESYINGTYDTPSMALEASAEENGLYWATSAWSGFMDTLNAFDKPSSIIDYTFEEKDIYEAIIMDLFECSVDYNVVEYIKNEQYKTNTKLLNTVLSEMKLTYNYDFTSTMDISSMSDNEKALVEEAMAKYFKEENMDIAALSDVTKFIGDAVDYASDLQSLIENVSSYYEIKKLSTAMEEIMQDMYDNCPSDNLALKAALLECITVMNSGDEAFAAEMCTYTAASAGKKAAEVGIDALWSNVKTSFSVANPEAFVLMMSYKASTCITALLFNADSIEENFCKIVALMNTEALVKEVYYNEKSTYNSSASEETAAVYNNMIDVMFNMLETDCDYAKDFAKAVNSSLTGKISAFLGDSSVDDFITQVENIQNSYSGLHEQSLKNWISGLEVDYPSQYENYKYILELSGDELSKAYKIECPVDVYVYDTDGVCVGYVKDNKPYCRSDAEITIGVNGDAKTIYMYGENEYTIVYKGNDSGSMDISITEYGVDGEETRNVYFNDISLTNGLTYTSEEKTDMGSYTLTSTSGRSIEADYDSEDSSAETYTITLTNGYFTDSPAFTAELHAGEKAEVAAFMFDGSEFLGWSSDVGTDIFDDADSMITEITMPSADVNIIAGISSTENSIIKGDLNGDNNVNRSDLILMRKYFAGWDIEIDSDAADLNGDGNVNRSDLILMRKYFAGWDVTFVN